MTGYKITAGDVEAGPQGRMEVLVEKKPSTGWMWKVFGVLLLLALSIGGARLYVWYQLERSGPTTGSEHTAAPVIMDSDVTTGTHSKLREISRRATAAIHLVGKYDEDDRKPSIEWRDAVGQAFSLGGLHLQDNQIIIPERGLYFVYSQVSFRVSYSEDKQGLSSLQPLSHRIWSSSTSVGKPVSLMNAVRSACQNLQEEDGLSGRGCYSTIYLGAVFHLNRGDRLWTETNQLTELETEEGKTFFGVFAL
ncbi:tumor necrosis factor b (TNF superfamily, member 2) [Cyprinodon tularosa]|uniref:tumor necrosis factor b (TNF superfamily, member 2) n=1 Tax=Cyprinodon tularosa TaxID=77115 RepID=UPI0018E25604|nr:tumor necrosis factor b (TNF superfamily, member 2) [Cyprinodon tularosa]